MHLEWWHWVVGGIVLILAELAIPSFFIVWFGLGALLVAIERHHAVAPADQQFHGGAADARGTPGDDGGSSHYNGHGSPR